MTLLETLSLPPGACVAVVGAGGKTALCYRLVQAAVAQHQRAIFTTTTRIWRPQDEVFDVLSIGPEVLALDGAWRTACVAKAVDGEVNLTPVPDSFMPVVQTKLMGLTPAEVCQLHAHHTDALLVVEADGARGLQLKAPGEHEPQIPAWADVVCVLVHLDAIGQPLDERIAHRVERIARITGTAPGQMITSELVIALMTHAEGGLKGIPASARKVAVLTQHAGHAPHPNADAIQRALVDHGFDLAMSIAPRVGSGALSFQKSSKL